MQVDRNMNKVQNKRPVITSLTKISLKRFHAELLSWSNWNLERWFLRREENQRIDSEKYARSKDENQKQTQPTYDTCLESDAGHIGERHLCSTNFFNSVLIRLTLFNKLTNLSTTSVHEALHIHANSACTLVKNSKLRLMIEQTSHLIQCNKNNINQPYSSSWVKVSQTSYKKGKKQKAIS